jgi:hypothetical protein
MSESANEPKNPVVPFTPVQLRPRRDGWTAKRQVAFIEALVETACFEEACRRVGMSDSSAYRLGLRHPAFAEACDAAIDVGLARLEQAAHSRSVRGVARPVFYKGEQVGEWRHYDERLTMFLLRTRRPERYGKWIERSPAPDPDQPDAAMKLIRAMDFFEDELPDESPGHPAQESDPDDGDAGSPPGAGEQPGERP